MIVPVVDEGLGTGPPGGAGAGRALAVDVPRDLRAAGGGQPARPRPAFAADTHLHADFLSGARQLAADDASDPGSRRSAVLRSPGLGDGDEVDLGGLTCGPGDPGSPSTSPTCCWTARRYWECSPEGRCWSVRRPVPTWPAREQTEPLARAQYASLRRLLALPDPTPVYPTHGAGSFCSAPPGAERTTTIGREKAANRCWPSPVRTRSSRSCCPAWAPSPAYFLRLPEENRRGPAIVASAPALAPLSADQVRTLRDGGVQVIDVRPVTDYAQGHIPGSLAISLRDAFATWLGWLVPDPATPARHRRLPRPGPRRGHLAGAEDRVRQPRRNVAGRPARLEGRREPGRGHPAAGSGAGQPGRRCRRPAGRRVRRRGTCPGPATSNSAPWPVRRPGWRASRW